MAIDTIEYFYSTRSIYAYFGAERVVALARRFGRRLVHHPVDLSKVVPAAGSMPFDQRSAAHKAYQFGREIERWSEYLAIPALVDPKHHFGGRGFSAGVILAAQAAGADVDRLNQFLAKHRIHPVIDKRFAFDDSPAAYAHLKSAAYFGKVVIDLS